MRRARLRAQDPAAGDEVATALTALGLRVVRSTTDDPAGDDGRSDDDLLVLVVGGCDGGPATTGDAIATLLARGAGGTLPARTPILLAVSAPVLSDPTLVDAAALADQVVVVPCPAAELALRVRLARAGSRDGVLRIDGLELDPAVHDARLEGRPLRLTHVEFELLSFFASHAGQVFTRATLLRRVWGYDDPGRTRTVDVHVRRVRAKLGPAADRIRTVRSVGYRFDAR